MVQRLKTRGQILTSGTGVQDEPEILVNMHLAESVLDVDTAGIGYPEDILPCGAASQRRRPGAGTAESHGLGGGNAQAVDRVDAGRKEHHTAIGRGVDRGLDGCRVVGEAVAYGVVRCGLDIGKTGAARRRDHRQIGKSHAPEGSVGLLDGHLGAARRAGLFCKGRYGDVAGLAKNAFTL